MAFITLLSDFGNKDATVAITKGIILQHCLDVTFIDLSHDIAPFNLQEPSYILASTYKMYPDNTIHVVLVDIFSEPCPKLLLLEHENQFFLGPDNGILPMALNNKFSNSWLCHQLPIEGTFLDWIKENGTIIKKIVNNGKGMLGLPPYPFQPKTIPNKINAIIKGETVDCDIVYIDNYENVVIDFTKEQLASIGKGRQFELKFKNVEAIGKISNSYADVKEGMELCRFNSNGFLEIGVNKGQAASQFGLKIGSLNNKIKIEFYDNKGGTNDIFG